MYSQVGILGSLTLKEATGLRASATYAEHITFNTLKIRHLKGNYGFQTDPWFSSGKTAALCIRFHGLRPSETASFERDKSFGYFEKSLSLVTFDALRIRAVWLFSVNDWLVIVLVRGGGTARCLRTPRTVPFWAGAWVSLTMRDLHGRERQDASVIGEGLGVAPWSGSIKEIGKNEGDSVDALDRCTTFHFCCILTYIWGGGRWREALKAWDLYSRDARYSDYIMIG